MELVAYNLRRLRKKAGMTQGELADRAGLSLRGIQGIEHRDRWPHPGTIKRLADALSMHPSALFADPDHAIKPTPEEALEILREAINRPNLPINLSGVPQDILEILPDIKDWALARHVLNQLRERKEITKTPTEDRRHK